ncbi:MAG: type II secretion system protein [Candidatus Omnitrophica bacterium]|nr:type II secretion system protein [Candidatus Omnitrophota bacterium]
MKKSFTPLEIPIVNSKKTKSLTGFTLIELLIVIVIVAIMASFGLQQYKIIMSKARGTEAMDLLSALAADGLKHYSIYGKYPEMTVVDGKLNGPTVSVPQDTANFTFSVTPWYFDPEDPYSGGYITFAATSKDGKSYDYGILVFIKFTVISIKSVLARLGLDPSKPPPEIKCGSYASIYQCYYYTVGGHKKSPWPGM